MTVLIALTTAGTSTGPFNLYSNTDNYATPFETNVPKASLVAGYLSVVVPAGTTTVQVRSLGTCTNSINIPIDLLTTSTSSTSTTSTTTTTVPTTTTTTVAPATNYRFYRCGGDGIASVVVSEAALINAGMAPGATLTVANTIEVSGSGNLTSCYAFDDMVSLPVTGQAVISFDQCDCLMPA